MTSGPDPGELPGFWGFMVFRHAPIPRKGSGKQQQQQPFESCYFQFYVHPNILTSLYSLIAFKKFWRLERSPVAFPL